jgi:hypothetical protein
VSEHVPEPWTFVLLALAAWRMWKLLADDVILEQPMDRLLRLIADRRRRDAVRSFIECYWCLGFWLAVAWWAAWLAAPKWAAVAAVPWALSAAVGLLGTVWSALTD